MISRIEMEDAIRVHSKVSDRVFYVACIVARLNGDIRPEDEKDKYSLGTFYIDMRDEEDYSKDMKHLVNCQVSVRLIYRKNSFDEDDYEEDRDYVRYITFPRRYLTSDDWELEASEEADRRKKVWNKIKQENIKRSLNEKMIEIKKLETELDDLMKENEEPNE